MLVDFLAFHQHWEPSYIRRMMLPMLSTVFLQEMAKNPVKTLLYGQYEFDSIQRLKIRYGHQFYVVKWKKAVPALGSIMNTILSEESDMQQDVVDVDESLDLGDESEGPRIHVEEGSCYLLTDENMDIVQAAFPEEVDRFLHEKVCSLFFLLYTYICTCILYLGHFFFLFTPAYLDFVMVICYNLI